MALRISKPNNATNAMIQGTKKLIGHLAVVFWIDNTSFGKPSSISGIPSIVKVSRALIFFHTTIKQQTTTATITTICHHHNNNNNNNSNNNNTNNRNNSSNNNNNNNNKLIILDWL